ncbi:DUF7504 family protein [Halomarina pelagica]|uniref:DUF7504 family protein n=1 Tax=Halomarina pelagica TaxID=2961599 RepID=UPI0020C3B382|nr:hypothetical protein [Halomarina sp. BND7]
MDARTGRDAGADDGAARFAAELRDLKRRGCHVLVAGRVGDAVRARQTRNLLGSPRLPRYRILALVDGELAEARTYLPGNLDRDAPNVSVLDFATPVRSGAAAAPAAVQTPGEGVHAPGDELFALRTALDREIADGLSTVGRVPGRLRVGVLTLGILLDTYGVERTRAFAAALGRSIRAASGLGHCQLPLEYDAAETRALQSAFDVRVDLRHRDGRPPEQRWRLTSTDRTTEWMLL